MHTGVMDIFIILCFAQVLRTHVPIIKRISFHLLILLDSLFYLDILYMLNKVGINDIINVYLS